MPVAVTLKVADAPGSLATDCGCAVMLGATAVPVPWTAKLYGSSSPSLLSMLIVASRSPMALGLNWTVKVVVPPPLETGVEGCEVTEKSAASGPDRATLGVPSRSRSPAPELAIVKVRSTVPVAMSALPKSV